jgi:hypothetical protein
MSIVFHFGPPIRTQEELESECMEDVVEEVVPKKKDTKDDDSESEKEKDEEKQPKRRIVRKLREDPIAGEDVTLPAFRKNGQCYSIDSLVRWLSTRRDDQFQNTNPTRGEPFTLEERAQVFQLAGVVDPSGGDPNMLFNGDADDEDDGEDDESDDFWNFDLLLDRVDEDGNFPENRVLNELNELFHPVNEWDPAEDDNYPIRAASRDGRIAIVNRLLQDERVNPAAHDNEAIIDASRNGHSEVVNRLLQDPRVVPAAHDNAALRLASHFGHLDVVNRLLQVDSVRQGVMDDADLRFSIEQLLGREIQ